MNRHIWNIIESNMSGYSGRKMNKKGYFFRETLELLNRSSDVGDPF
jgi:hypothetical protein